MCLQVILELFANAIGIMVGICLLFIILIYLVGFLIGAFIGGVALLLLALTNPLNWILLIAIIVTGYLLLCR